MKDCQSPELDFFYGIFGTACEKETKEFIYYSWNNCTLAEELIEDDKVALTWKF